MDFELIMHHFDLSDAISCCIILTLIAMLAIDKRVVIRL